MPRSGCLSRNATTTFLASLEPPAIAALSPRLRQRTGSYLGGVSGSFGGLSAGAFPPGASVSTGGGAMYLRRLTQASEALRVPAAAIASASASILALPSFCHHSFQSTGSSAYLRPVEWRRALNRGGRVGEAGGGRARRGIRAG